jgi:hypothetical protein
VAGKGRGIRKLESLLLTKYKDDIAFILALLSSVDDEHVLISGEYSVRVVHKWRHPEIYTPAGQFSSAEAF